MIIPEIVYALSAFGGKHATSLRVIKRRAWGLVLLGLYVGSGIKTTAFAQSKPDWEAWRGVNRIRGVATAIDRTQRYEVTDMYVSDTHDEESSVYRFELVPEETMPGYGVPLAQAMQYRGSEVSIRWVQTECQASGVKNHHNTFTTRDAHGTTSVTSNFSGPLSEKSVIQFSIHTGNGTWDCHVPGDLQNPYQEHIHGEGTLPDYNHDEVREKRTGLDVAVWSNPLPKKPGYISGKFDKDIPYADKPDLKFHRLMRIELWPEFEDVELEITIDDYEKWRPLGNIGDSHLAGARLPVKAILKPKGGKLAPTLTPKRFIFKLLDTSREPGVCMNWPLGAKDNDRDLKLAAAVAFPDNTLDSEGQTLEIRQQTLDADGHYTAGAHIDSFDFGARAELRVTCELSDGREIVGVLKAPKGDQDIVFLPKGRREGDWIAMSWRKANNVVDLPDDDDSEDDPKGDGNQGDGYTLYEEYRGWVENGKRIEGDPKKKDFMILNQRGADARRGIALFERLSGLTVHSKFRDKLEMAYDPRRPMNANHDNGPHRVDQYGVVIYGGNGLPGAFTAGTKEADRHHAFRPHSVKAIFLENTDPGNGPAYQLSIAYGTGKSLSQRDAEMTVDRAVAHELLHTVGVEHHGDFGNGKVCFYFQGPTALYNPTGTARYTENGPQRMWSESYDNPSKTGGDWATERGATLTLKWEDTLKDVFEDQLPYYQQELEKYRRLYLQDLSPNAELDGLAKRFGTTTSFMREYLAEVMAASGLVKVAMVGSKNGLESGNDLCVMRYYFATAYRQDGKQNDHFLIRTGGGTVSAGREICHSPKGTGNNAASHQPQSRFGDAYQDRGNCAEQICPNDAIPPRAVVEQSSPRK